jgi:hypothetical protein
LRVRSAERFRGAGERSSRPLPAYWSHAIPFALSAFATRRSIYSRSVENSGDTQALGIVAYALNHLADAEPEDDRASARLNRIIETLPTADAQLLRETVRSVERESGRGAKLMAMFGRQPTPWNHEGVSSLPDFMPGINAALAKSAAAPDDQSRMKAGLSGLARGVADWQRESEGFSERASANQEAMMAMMAKARQAHEAMLSLPRRQPSPMMTFGMPQQHGFRPRGY